MSQGRRSTTGVPEGCNMAVLGMLFLALAFSKAIESTCRSVDAVAYADNWAWIAGSNDASREMLRASKAFTAFFDVAIATSTDQLKTWMWSTSKKGRKQLRIHAQEEGYVVPIEARDLGADISYSRQWRHTTQMQRIQQARVQLLRIGTANTTFEGRLQLL